MGIYTHTIRNCINSIKLGSLYPSNFGLRKTKYPATLKKVSCTTRAVEIRTKMVA